MTTNKRAILELCDDIRQANDRLGMFSDHEGDENGSTYHFWQQGPGEFEVSCQIAIEGHQRAIKAWRKIRTANLRRLRSVTS